MNPDNANSASTTGTTSPSGGASPPPGPFSEAEFLAKQQEAAKRAISNVVTQLTHDIGRGLDPRGWTKEHPWMMVAGATVAGFVGAVMAVPSKEEQALRRLARLEEALLPKTKAEPKAAAAAGDAKHVDEDDGGAKSYAKGHTSFLGGLGRQVLEAVKPAILSALTAGITAKASQPEPAPVQPPPAPTGGAVYAAAQTGAPDPSAAI